MLGLAIRVAAIACLIPTGIGFGAYGLYMAVVADLGPPLAGLMVGAVAILAAVLIALPGPRRRAGPPPAAASISHPAEIEALAAIARDKPLTAVALSALVGAAGAATSK
ncbi:hypothetical protein [Zavarzinia compransoris]|uniref:Uncharacterized protein n=1 Tax=Zavarzinia compransoris TaxID=1264899 RepID=A0A317ED28_9PROT|nr:hypothetical protein [Zavarzinia compransoris]PWR24050.1 hypothetical protein DKG75_05780 [Zavarzinia compransoris]TDP48313.1 hypothetical protein DES42_102616 [Zavarzinia compransoris]